MVPVSRHIDLVRPMRKRYSIRELACALASGSAQSAPTAARKRKGGILEDAPVPFTSIKRARSLSNRMVEELTQAIIAGKL